MDPIHPVWEASLPLWVLLLKACLQHDMQQRVSSCHARPCQNMPRQKVSCHPIPCIAARATKGNRQTFVFSFCFVFHGKICLKLPQMGPGVFFCPTNPDLADILGRTDLDFENFHFFDFLDPNFLAGPWARCGRDFLPLTNVFVTHPTIDAARALL